MTDLKREEWLLRIEKDIQELKERLKHLEELIYLRSR